MKRVIAGVAVTVAMIAGAAPIGATTTPTVPVAVTPTGKPSGYVAQCERQVRSWTHTNRAWFREADASIDCVWKPGRFSGVYTSATRTVTINAWGMFHWGIRPGPFYRKLLTHEVAHAWGDMDGRLKGREARYAEIRGIPAGEVVEDYAETVAVDRGCCYVSWGDPRQTFIWQSRLTSAHLDTLHNEGFLPRW